MASATIADFASCHVELKLPHTHTPSQSYGYRKVPFLAASLHARPATPLRFLAFGLGVSRGSDGTSAVPSLPSILRSFLRSSQKGPKGMPKLVPGI